MSLKPRPIGPVPELTAYVARAAFPKGNPYLRLRDELGTVFARRRLRRPLPRRGQPALAPWRLALVTVLQFREGLSDRRAADAVRARIDWKYLLGLELTDPGSTSPCSASSAPGCSPARPRSGCWRSCWAAARRLGLLKARGRQRTDATHVLASVRAMNRLELLAETLRAALNELAAAAPDWLRGRPRRLVQALRAPGRGRPPAASGGRAGEAYVVRACTERPSPIRAHPRKHRPISSSCKASGEELDRGEVDHGCGRGEGCLEVLGQPSVAAEPAQRPLNSRPYSVAKMGFEWSA